MAFVETPDEICASAAEQAPLTEEEREWFIKRLTAIGVEQNLAASALDYACGGEGDDQE